MIVESVTKETPTKSKKMKGLKRKRKEGSTGKRKESASEKEIVNRPMSIPCSLTPLSDPKRGVIY